MEMFLMIMMILAIVLIFGILGVYLVGLWKLFKKAGRNGWEAIIPFYNTWVLTEISGLAWWYALIIIFANFGAYSESVIGSILSLAALVAQFFVFYNLSKKFNKDVGIAILSIIFPFVMIPVMGFSNSFRYDKDVVVSENGPINAKGNNSNANENNSNANENNSNANVSDNSDENTQEKRFCSHCGSQVREDSKYCGNCGEKIVK